MVELSAHTAPNDVFQDAMRQAFVSVPKADLAGKLRHSFAFSKALQEHEKQYGEQVQRTDTVKGTVVGGNGKPIHYSVIYSDGNAALVATHEGQTMIAFDPSNGSKDWRVNLEGIVNKPTLFQTPQVEGALQNMRAVTYENGKRETNLMWHMVNGTEAAHAGYVDALHELPNPNTPSLYARVNEEVTRQNEGKQAQVTITGYSKGGGMAQIYAGEVLRDPQKPEIRIDSVVTHLAPRPVNTAFAERSEVLLNAQGGEAFHVVSKSEAVSTFIRPNSTNIGKTIYLNENDSGLVTAQIFQSGRVEADSSIFSRNSDGLITRHTSEYEQRLGALTNGNLRYVDRYERPAIMGVQISEADLSHLTPSLPHFKHSQSMAHGLG